MLAWQIVSDNAITFKKLFLEKLWPQYLALCESSIIVSILMRLNIITMILSYCGWISSPANPVLPDGRPENPAVAGDGGGEESERKEKEHPDPDPPEWGFNSWLVQCYVLSQVHIAKFPQEQTLDKCLNVFHHKGDIVWRILPQLSSMWTDHLSFYIGLFKMTLV